MEARSEAIAGVVSNMDIDSGAGAAIVADVVPKIDDDADAEVGVDSDGWPGCCRSPLLFSIFSYFSFFA